MRVDGKPPQSGPTGPYGLVAMPDAQARALCSRILREEGLSPVTVEDGEAAMAVVDERGAPAIVVTELSMPRLDGFALLEALRRRFSPAETTALVLSGFAHLRQTAAELQDKLGIAWIVPKESGELFLRHAAHQSLAGKTLREPEPPPGERHQDPGRAERMGAMALVDDAPPDEVLQAIVADTAQLFGVPVALVSLVLPDRQWFKAYFGLGGDLLQRRSTPIDQAFCRHVVDAGETLVVPNARANPYFRSNPLVQAGIVGSYAGAPLVTSKGEVLGTLCIIDSKPLGIDAGKVKGLETLARRVVGELQLAIRQQQGPWQQSTVPATLSALGGSLSGLDSGVILFGPDRRVRFANEVVEKVLGLPAASVMSATRDELLRSIASQTDDPVEFMIRLQLPRQGSFAFRGEFELPARRRRIRWVEEPVPAEDGNGQACFVKDVTAEYLGQQLAVLPGGRPFAERGRRDSASQAILLELARAKQDAVPISFVLLDARLSLRGQGRGGTMTHQQAAVQLFEVLRSCIRSTDTLMRWAPNEFLVALPQAGLAAATALGERIQREVRAAGSPYTVCVGVTELGKEEDFHLALARASTQISRQRAAGSSGDSRRPVGQAR